MAKEIKPYNWFHKNLSDREAASQMPTPVNEDVDEMFASLLAPWPCPYMDSGGVK